jgi:hypothetical protein
LKICRHLYTRANKEKNTEGNTDSLQPWKNFS